MPTKKFILKNFAPGTKYNNTKKTNNLFNLSSLGIDSNQKAIKTSLALGTSQTNDLNQVSSVYNDSNDNFGNDGDLFKSKYLEYRDLTKSNGEFIAFFNKSYSLRRDYLRQFAKNGEINFVLETISDEAIVTNENNYFAELDIDKLKSNLNKNNTIVDQLISNVEISFKHVYSIFGFDKSNDAWAYFKTFLIDGFLAFEIIFEYDENKNAKNIIAFKELDPVTLQPDFVKDENGNFIKVWFQNKGDKNNERIIPDSNLIYLSWCRGNFSESSNISYLEGLTRSFNLLRQLENSRIIWNIENAQKKIKITVPVNNMSTDRARQRLSELRSYYNEDTIIDDFSGEVTVNGMPKFSFTKTYLFPSQGGSSTTDIGEIANEGYDMNSTDQLKYFWRRFILETKVPANRFTLDPTSSQSNALTGESTITREEYAFNRFIQRLRSSFKEILLKPLWVQLCLKMPKLIYSDYIKSCLGIKYNEENVFTLAKERSIITEGSNTINNLLGIKKMDGTAYFNTDFLVKKYLGLTDEDLELNKKYQYAEEIRMAEKQKNKAKQAQQPGMTEESSPYNGFGGGETEGFGGGTEGFGGGETEGFGGAETAGFGGGETGETGFGGAETTGIGETTSPAAPTPTPTTETGF